MELLCRIHFTVSGRYTNLDDIGLGAIDSIKSVSISNVYQLASDYPNQYVTFTGSISNLPVSGNYRYVGRCLRFGQYAQIVLINMETYTVYQNYNRGYDFGGQWSGWDSNVRNADLKVTLKNNARLEIYSDFDTSYIDSFSGNTRRHRLVWSDGGLTLYKYSGNTNTKIWSSY